MTPDRVWVHTTAEYGLILNTHKNQSLLLIKAVIVSIY